jgi:hypothetical protein
MQFKKVFPLILTLLLSVISSHSGLAQDATPEVTATAIATSVPIVVTQPPAQDVAVLVVDVFEENTTVAPTPVESLTTDPTTGQPLPDQCAISPVGQDGLAVQGNATSSLFPLSHPHGNLVFQHLKNVLTDEYGGSTNSADPNSHIEIENAPNAELWSTSKGNVWLVGVDSQEYNIGLIAKRVDAVIDLLHTKNAINHFVINMSFGLVPCENIPSVNIDDYINELAKWGINPPYDTSNPLGAIAAALVTSKSNPDTLAALIAIRDANPDAFTFLHLAVMQPKIQVALTPANPPIATDLPNFDYFQNSDPNVTIVRVASAGNDGLSFPYYPAANRNVLSVSAAYAFYDHNNATPSNCQLGSPSDIYGYLNSLGYPALAVDQIIHSVLSPISNSGEVVENGRSTLHPNYYLKAYTADADVLGCLTGTSFSAPNMSLKMAFDQAWRNSTRCTVQGALMPEPPLSHNKWDNLTVDDAAQAYCPDF